MSESSNSADAVRQPPGTDAPLAETPVIPVTVIETPSGATPEAAPVAETPAAETTAAPVATEPVADPAKPEVKPDAPVTETPLPPVYTDFTLPEGFKAEPAMLAKAQEVFGKLGLPQESAQELVNLHTEVTQQAVQGAFTQATEYWTNKSQEWRKEVETDPAIGGNRLQTSLNRARAVWSDAIPNEADRSRLFADLTDTKIGDHPVLTRAMTEIGRRFEQIYQLTGTTSWTDAMKKLREPSAPPPGNPARAPGTGGRAADRRYQNQK